MAGTNIGQAYVQILPETTKFGSTLKSEISQDISDAGKDSGDSFVSGFVGSVGAVTAAATAAVASGAAALTSAVIEQTSGLESSMAQVKTIMDTTQMSVSDMQNGLVGLSNQMGISTAELAETVYNVVSATGDTANALNLAEQAAKLATAGFTDTGSSLGVLTTAMNAYGLSAEEASNISDSLITVQNLGVTTVAELSASMGKAIASASAYGVNLENLESAYISITKAGISTAEGTTYISSMLKELGDSGSTVSGILQDQTGKAFNELMNEGYSLGDVLGILYDSVEGDSTALMNLWSSAEAGKASSAIVSQGLEEFNNNLEAIENSAGATETAFATMQETFANKAQIMSTTWDNLLAGMGTAGADVEALTTDFTNAFSDMIESATPIIDNLAVALPTVIDTMSTEIPGLVDTLLPPLTTAFSTMISNFADALPTLISTTATMVPNLVQAGVDVFTSMVGNLDQIVSPLIQALPGTASTIIEGVVGVIPDFVSGLGTVAGEIVASLPGIIGTIVSSIPDILTGLSEGVVGAVTNFMTAVFADADYQAAIDAINTQLESVQTANDNLTTSIGNAKKAYEDQTTSAELNAAAAEAVYGKIQSLMEQEDLDAGKKEVIKGLVDELNGLIPGLALAYDEETNSLSATNEEILANIENMKAQARQTAVIDLYTDALRSQAEAEMNLQSAKSAVIAVLDQYGIAHEDVSLVLEAYKGNIGAAIELQGKYNLSALDGFNGFNQFGDAIIGVADALENKKAADEQATLAEELLTEKTLEATAATTEQTETVEANADTLEAKYEAVFGVSMPASLQTAINAAADAGVEIPAELTDGIISGEISVNDAVTEVNSLISDTLSAPNNDGTNSGIGEEITSEVAAGMESAVADVTEASAEVAAEATNGVIDVPADMMEQGLEASQKMADGISSNLTKVQAELRKMAGYFQTELIGIGTDLQSRGNLATALLASAITNTTASEVIPAINNMCAGIYNNAGVLPGWLNYVGSMAGQGLYNGLAAWAGTLSQLAWNLASQINTAARAALKINSPSGAMRENGHLTIEGMAIGITENGHLAIEAMEGVTGEVIAASNRMTDEVSNDAVLTMIGNGVDITNDIRSTVSGAVAADVNINNMDRMETMIGYMSMLLDKVDKLSRMKMVLDTGATAGGLASDMDREFGRMEELEGRL